jgi:hypothetical protein
MRKCVGRQPAASFHREPGTVADRSCGQSALRASRRQQDGLLTWGYAAGLYFEQWREMV